MSNSKGDGFMSLIFFITILSPDSVASYCICWPALFCFYPSC